MTRYHSALLLMSLACPAALAEGPPPTSAPQVAPAPWLSVEDAISSNLDRRDPFRAGQCSFQFLGGYYQKTGWGPGGLPLNYDPLDFRFGWMLTDPCDDHGWLRGSVETLFAVNYSPIIREFGNYLTGPSLLFRYNFVQQECAFVPYIQCGAGLAFNDAWKNKQQELIGGKVEFLLQGGIGGRLMLTEKLSFDAEFGFQHISNGTIYLRNGGVNNLGGGVGFTYTFGKME